MLEGSLEEPGQKLKRGLLICGVGVFVKWSLEGALSSQTGKDTHKAIYVYIDTQN